jgi:hypothetical protein
MDPLLGRFDFFSCPILPNDKFPKSISIVCFLAVNPPPSPLSHENLNIFEDGFLPFRPPSPKLSYSQSRPLIATPESFHLSSRSD